MRTSSIGSDQVKGASVRFSRIWSRMSGEVKAARVADVKAEDKEVVVDGVAREDEVVEVEEEEDCIEG